MVRLWQYGVYNCVHMRQVPRCRHFSIDKTRDPLRILFCGSDAFSIASLKALYRQHIDDANLIASIDVVCKTPKATGRGLKTVRQGQHQSNHIVIPQY